MTYPITHARRVLAAIRAGQHVNPDDLAWLGDGLERYLAGAPYVSLDGALGLKPGWGEKGWWSIEPKIKRDLAIAKIDQQLFGQLSVADAAREILALVRKHRERRPDATINEAELLRDLNREGAQFPAKRQLINIITAKRLEAGAEIRPILKFHDANFPICLSTSSSSEGNRADDESSGPARIR